MDANQLSQIRERFHAVNDVEALAALCVDIQIMQATPGKEVRPIQAAELQKFSSPRRRPDRYRMFAIPKKNGKIRLISAPVRRLKEIQGVLNDIFTAFYDPMPYAHGFVPGKGVRTNADVHVGKDFILNIDIKDFFHSITYKQVKRMLHGPPFYIGNEQAPLIRTIAGLCCFEPDRSQPDVRCLPQGAPTSPMVTNLVCISMDRRLAGIAAMFGATYTRYADDLTFSSDEPVLNKSFLRKVEEVLAGYGFELNPDKTRLQKKGYRQEVTGITVNERTNVPRNMLRELRAKLHNWETYGYKEAARLYKADQDRKGVRTGAKFFNHVTGQLSYVVMVKGKDDPVSRKLMDQYRDIMMYDALYKTRYWKKVLAELEKLGIGLHLKTD